MDGTDKLVCRSVFGQCSGTGRDTVLRFIICGREPFQARVCLSAFALRFAKPPGPLCESPLCSKLAQPHAWWCAFGQHHVRSRLHPGGLPIRSSQGSRLRRMLEVSLGPRKGLVTPICWTNKIVVGASPSRNESQHVRGETSAPMFGR